MDKSVELFLNDAAETVAKLFDRHPSLVESMKLQLLQLQTVKHVPLCRTVLKNEFERERREELKNPASKKEESGKKKIRVYVDGCFDIMHSGHYNVLRQAKALGDILIAGVHSNAEIRRNKGRPVMSDEERLRLVSNCKYVDEVVFDTPYAPSLALLDREDIRADFGVHGDDLPVAVGASKHAYWELQEAGRLRIVKRTEGVSTTDLVGRLLLATTEMSSREPRKSRANSDVDENSSLGVSARDATAPTVKVADELSRYLPTSSRVAQFSNRRLPGKGDRVVYIAGDFDMFHIGHVGILEKARKLGDFLLVGIWDNKTIQIKGGNDDKFNTSWSFPIMNLHERVVNVLSCKLVDDVIIGAPWRVSQDLITTFNIQVVVQVTGNSPSMIDTSDCFDIPKKEGLLRQVEIDDSNFSTEKLVQRIVDNRKSYVKRNASRAKKEKDYLEKDKKFIEEVADE